MVNSLLFLISSAICKFNQNEKYLIQNDLSERCICFKFAMYLEREINCSSEFNQYVVDVEYNRGAECKSNNPKKLYDKKIVVDLIVHKRGYDAVFGFDNLICCEMKKSTDKRGCDSDEKRLAALTNYSYGFNYRLGVMLFVDMSEKLLTIKRTFELK